MNDSNIAIDVSKCLACGNCVDRCIMDNLRLVLPPCRQASLLDINYQGILRLAAQGNMTEAARELRRCTPFGGFLAAWGDAPASRACSRGHSGGALNFAGILAYLVRTQEDAVYGPAGRLPRSHKKAVVAGSDAAALQAAFSLRMGGHAVTVLSASPCPSVEGVPAPILEKTMAMLKGMGIVFETADAFNVEELCRNFDAVILTGSAADGMSADEYGLVRDNLFAVIGGDSQNPLQAMAGAVRAAHAARNLLEGFSVDYEGNQRVARGLERFHGLSEEQEDAPEAAPVVCSGDGFTEEEVKAEASRCLGCGRPVERNMTCWYCLPCEVVCPTQALHVRIPYLIR